MRENKAHRKNIKIVANKMTKIMRYTFEEEFRLDHPETIGEADRHFDLDNYKDWLENQLIEARKQLALCNVVGRSEQFSCDCPSEKQNKTHETL